MRIRADLHIHSRYSRATSSKLTPPYLERWARIKGIELLGTGDCTHPLWLGELREQLEDAEPGLYTLKESLRPAFDAGPTLAEGLPRLGNGQTPLPRFILTGEISTIYKREGRTRKIHHLIILPDFKAAAAFQAALEGHGGNIRSDGRPILGIDSRDLLAMLLDTDDRALLIPAHIWTPWFSALGANSGFDSIEECYGELASRIPAVETGLSSNPPMNWAVRSLDRFAIISNSDAHSPDKLGREGTVFDMDYSFASFRAAVGSPLETIEFFPQEGKYHYDGHRSCGICLSPEAAAAAEGLCPVCRRPLTRGVMGRVLELADSPVDESAPCKQEDAAGNRRPWRALIPLKEILGELLETGPASRKVEALYGGLIEKSGSELSLLADAEQGEIEALRLPGLSGKLLAGAIARMRSGRVFISPGYDGVYGKIRVFRPGQKIRHEKTADLFEETGSNTAAEEGESAPVPRSIPASGKNGKGSGNKKNRSGKGRKECIPIPASGLSDEQAEAVSSSAREAIIIAGPGTGKTSVLAARIAELLRKGIDPASILAVSFTVKAAAELRERVAGTAGGVPAGKGCDSNAAGITGGITGGITSGIGSGISAGLTVATFHSFCASLLREQGPERGIPAGFRIVTGPERDELLEEIAEAANLKRSAGIRRLGDYIESRKRFLLLPGEAEPNFGRRSSRTGPQAAPRILSPEPVLDSLARLAAELGIPPMDGSLEEAYRLYRSRLRAESLLDFEDLIAGTLRLLATHGDLLDACRARYRHILIDEYQDINFAQYGLIRLLAPGSALAGDASPELRVIGDPDQAIYAFRGSDKRFIDRFMPDYPGAAQFRLRRSFRCAAPILNAAGRLTGAPLEGTGHGGAELFRFTFPTEKSEAEGIARRIAALTGGTSFFAIDSNTVSSGNSAEGRRQDDSGDDAYGADGADGAVGAVGETSPGDCAILLRSAILARPIIKALGDHGIPCELTGDKPWWEEEPARSVISLLWESVLRERTGKPPKDAAAPESPGTTPGLSLKGKTPPEAIRTALAFMESGNATGSVRKKRGPAPGGDDILQRLINAAAFYDDTGEFLDTLAVSGGTNDGVPEIKREGVRIMTIHGSKGLEFDHVFIPAMEDGLLPFTLYEEGRNIPDSLIAEEQRLLYVAMTRARRGLYLSRAESRRYGNRKLALEPSRFLKHLETVIPQAREIRLKPKNPQQELF
ncbi:MAG: UvrD-helicase domain-containing protein [Treponema sp.]|jgi:uncharacterized protein (TIGR00375 family)|nr:UvrD-helicase domain-containing protein [Treponema sp.]